MENIIQQIALDLVEKITKKAFDAKISDIDTLASDVLADCKTAACEIASLIKLATVMFLSWMQCWDFKDMNASAAMSEQGL